MVPVNCEIAIFDLKGALAPQDKPLMLQPVLFCPVLTWAAQELMDCGVQRYFIVCPENCRQEVLDDLPGCDVTFFDHAEAALSAAGGDVVMVPGPVVPVYGPEDGRSVYAADSQVLLARLRVLTRRKGSGRTNVFTLADLTVDTAARSAVRAGTPLTLSAREYALLEYLIRNKGIILSREQIENNLWNYDYAGGTNVVDVYISYLRKKLDGVHEKKLLHTVRGMGWVLKEDV